MKKYNTPVIKFSKIDNKDVIVTSISIYIEDADDSAVLSRERDNYENEW